MKLLLDESADFRLSSYLTDNGHDVTSIAHDYPHALSDREVLQTAHQEERILIANDRDFGELISRPALPHSGVILFRLRTTALAAKIARLDYALTHYSGPWSNFLVVTDQRVRMRRGG